MESMENIICDLVSRMSIERLDSDGIHNHAFKNSTLDLACEVEFRRLADAVARTHNAQVKSYNPHKFSFRPNNQFIEVIVRWNFVPENEEGFKIVVEAISV